MKALFFDCSSGISGNMTLGALLEILGDEKDFLDELNKLNVDGYHLHISKVIKNGITGTHIDVHVEEDGHAHEHENNEHPHHHHHEHHHEHKHDDGHHHHHDHRNLYDIYKIIDNSAIDKKAKDLAKRIFMRVAKAESKVHNESLENVHFHEVGAIDSIVDIIGTAILITKINPDVIYSSVVNDGFGFINCAHGMISVPVPATSEIFADSQVISKQIDIDTELVTPTGAAIIAELATSYGSMPAMNIKKIGWGAGTKDLQIPNVLKIAYGEMNDEIHQNILVIETNIDDCSSEILGYTLTKLFENGALDVFYTPIYMKKNRPAYRLTVACKKQDLEVIQDIIFKETTTIGIRYREEQRTILPRTKDTVTTNFGDVEVKKVIHGKEIYIYPEFESLKKLAKEKNVSLKDLYNAIQKCI